MKQTGNIPQNNYQYSSTQITSFKQFGILTKILLVVCYGLILLQVVTFIITLPFYIATFIEVPLVQTDITSFFINTESLYGFYIGLLYLTPLPFIISAICIITLINFYIVQKKYSVAVKQKKILKFGMIIAVCYLLISLMTNGIALLADMQPNNIKVEPDYTDQELRQMYGTDPMNTQTPDEPSR